MESHDWNFQGDIVNSKDTYLLVSWTWKYFGQLQVYYSYCDMLTDGTCMEEGSIAGNLSKRYFKSEMLEKKLSCILEIRKLKSRWVLPSVLLLVVKLRLTGRNKRLANLYLI